MNLENPAKKERLKIGSYLRKVRQNNGLKIADCENENISTATISYIENGQTNVTVNKIKQYCSILGIDYYQLPHLIRQEANKTLAIQKEYLEMLAPIETYIESTKQNKGLSKLNQIKKPPESVLHVIYYLKGRCYTQQNKPQTASSFYNKALKHIEKNPELLKSNIQSCCLNQLSKISYYKNQFQKAVEYVQTGLDQFVENGERKHIKPSLHMNKVVYLERLGHLPEAQENLQTLWEMEGNGEIENIEVILNMHDVQGQVYRRSKMYDEGIKIVNEGLIKAQINKKNNRVVELWTTLASIYIDTGELKKAESILLLALSLKREVYEKHLFLPIHIKLGQIYIKQGEYQKAKSILEEVTNQKTDQMNISRYIQALMVLGDCFLIRNDFTKALEPYKTALKLARKHSLVYQECDLLRKLCICWEQVDEKKFQKYLVEYFHLDIQLSEKGGEYFD